MLRLLASNKKSSIKLSDWPVPDDVTRAAYGCGDKPVPVADEVRVADDDGVLDGLLVWVVVLVEEDDAVSDEDDELDGVSVDDPEGVALEESVLDVELVDDGVHDGVDDDDGVTEGEAVLLAVHDDDPVNDGVADRVDDNDRDIVADAVAVAVEVMDADGGKSTTL